MPLRLPPLMLAVAVWYVSAGGAFAEESDAAKKQRALGDLSQLATAMGYLQADCGCLPSDAQGLASLLSDPGFKGWNGPYIRGALPSDPWRSPYRYRLTKDFYEIRSAGPDAKFDTSDDLVR